MEIFKQIVEKEIAFDEGMDPEFKELLVLSLKKDPNERADAKRLKKCSIFKTTNFEAIFNTEPPIDRKELQRDIETSAESSSSSQFLF